MKRTFHDKDQAFEWARSEAVVLKRPVDIIADTHSWIVNTRGTPDVVSVYAIAFPDGEVAIQSLQRNPQGWWMESEA